MNIEYAAKKHNNIIIMLFNHGVTLYTNIKISDETKELIKSNYKKGLVLYDNLSYNQIAEYVRNSRADGGTDFLAPFEMLEYIHEIMDMKPEIVFLSDGQNGETLTDAHLAFLSKYKNNITTMGIGNKSNFDHETLSKMSKNNDTVEGESADIIQNELLAQMSDCEGLNAPNIWRNATITLMSSKNNMKLGTLMNVTKITKNEFDAFTPINTITDDDLILHTYNNNLIIKKKDSEINTNDVSIKNTIVFMVDQSGSMQSPATNQHYNIIDSGSPLSIVEDEEDDDIDDVYVKYTITFPVIKSYQQILLNFDDPTKIKGQITYTDKDNINQSMIINDMSRWSTTPLSDLAIPAELSNTHQMIDIIIDISNCINMANISNKTNKIGYFRKMNAICNQNKNFIKNMISMPISNYCLIELFQYIIKQSKKLYQSTLTPGQQNIDNLLRGSSCPASAVRNISAAVTMSAVCGRTPSGVPRNEENQDSQVDHDNSMCTICYSEIREYVFSCGHCYSCKDCAEKLLISTPENKCSYCKKDVTSIRKITMSEDQKNSEHYYKCITPDCFNLATNIASCKPINEDDSGYHLTHCDKCYKTLIRKYKKQKQTHICFCGNDIKEFKGNIIFP